MTIAGLMNQTLTLYNRSGRGGDGRPSFGAGTSINARLQPKTKRKLLGNGDVLTIDAMAFVPADTTIASDDKVTAGGITYRVVEVYPVPGGNGATHHKEVNLVKWQ